MVEDKIKPPEKINLIPGAEPSSRMDPWWWLVAGVFALAGGLMLFKPDPFLDIFKYVWVGIGITVLVAVVSYFLMLIFGLFGALGRLSKNTILRGLATFYVEIVRGIPLLVQLIWWYFAFPVIIQSIGQGLNFGPMMNYQANPIVMAIWGMTFCYGAYMSEIYRAGIQSIPKGQMEAARSLGMSHTQAMRFIILPQALRVVLPPMGNEFISLLKDTSLVSTVAVADMVRLGREFTATNFNPIEVWSMIALLYLILTLLSSRLINYIEKKTAFSR
jgi:polar amino acid transport system permease protein